ncbi:DNA replication protein DnaC [Roseateles asaccharophilus]|uniref:ATP-binding protein n=1 Tax=Roseateles asaccharophilus TaxID=582607 RepID=UPI003836ECAF
MHSKPLIRIGSGLACSACLAASSLPATLALGDLRARTAARDLAARARAAGVPEEFEGKGFDSFVAETDRAAQVAQALEGYCAEFHAKRFKRKGFIFIGAPGTAKTHIACAMVQALLARGFSPKYTSLPRLTRELRAGFGRPGVAEGVVRAHVDADLLVLDEIDLHGASDHDYNTLYDIINTRYERHGYPTLAISNREIGRLNVDLDERVTSRILSGTQPMVFDWQGRRGDRALHAGGGSR